MPTHKNRGKNKENSIGAGQHPTTIATSSHKFVNHSEYRCETPVVMIVHRRPADAIKVLERIRAAKAKKIYVVADGPGNPQDHAACQETRALFDNLDWDCEVVRVFAEKNMGLRPRIESGLSEVFKREKQAIILEDDCVASPSFFPYCDELLAHYADNKKVSMISGDNAHGYTGADTSYHFSRFNLIWGWATWARAWQDYDFGMSMWPAARDSEFLYYLFRSKKSAGYWKTVMNQNYDGGNSWARVWMMSNWLYDKVTAVPECNLISNIGFDAETATHTKNTANIRAYSNIDNVTFPLRHPENLIVDDEADRTADMVIFSRDADIFSNRVGGTGKDVLSVPHHENFRRAGLASHATNVAIAIYNRNTQELAGKYHLLTEANRKEYLAWLINTSITDPDLTGDVRSAFEQLLS